jgi:hypothetical protein
MKVDFDFLLKLFLVAEMEEVVKSAVSVQTH